MKLITDTKRNGKVCYVQVKDLLFLAKYTGNKRLMQDYIDAIDKGKSDSDFVKVNGESYIRAFELCDYIVDFNKYNKKDVNFNYLSNLVKMKTYAMCRNIKEKEGLDYQIDGVRDIIAFKNGELEYKIPLLPDGRVEMFDNTNEYLFRSTIIDGYFVLEKVGKGDLNEQDYKNFLDVSVKKVFDVFYPGVKEKIYSSFVVGNTLVVSIKKRESKRKKNNVNKTLSKSTKDI